MDCEKRGNIFNIQRFSVQDGGGVRTIIFLKGCPLECTWCSNPESQAGGPSLMYQPMKCLGCLRCVAVCPKDAIAGEDGRPVIDREKCDACGKCAETCYAGALELSGKEMSVGEVMEEVMRDALLYRHSGGGVTLSGGEPLAQADFSAALLRACKENGLHTAVETCGYAPWGDIEKILPYTDLFLYDLKKMDAEKHKEATGKDNALIWENLTRVAKSGTEVVARLPIIPGINDSDTDIRAVGAFLRNVGVGQAHVLPFHKLGQHKYESLGGSYLFKGVENLSDERIDVIADMLEEYGLHVKVYKH